MQFTLSKWLHCMIDSGKFDKSHYCTGCLAEVTEVLGPLCAPYAEALLSVVLKELAAAADDANCRNAAFCAGLLAQHAPSVVQPHLPRLLQVLPYPQGPSIAPCHHSPLLSP